MLVVDASVAALWALPQEHAALASDVLTSGLELLAPRLLRLEIASPLLRAVRRGEMDVERARRVIEVLLPANVTLLDEPRDDLQAFAIAAEHGGTCLDGVYVALARRLGARLVTNDRQMHRIALAAGIECRQLTEGPPW